MLSQLLLEHLHHLCHEDSQLHGMELITSHNLIAMPWDGQWDPNKRQSHSGKIPFDT